MKPGFETRRHFSHGSRGLDPSVTCLVETVAQNSWFSLLGCTQASGQAVGMGLVLSREWGELQFGGKTSPICPPRLGSCTCWVCHVFDLVVCGPTSPSTHSVSMLSPKLGATSSVTIHVPGPPAQTRRTVFPKEGGGKWGSSLLSCKEQEQLGFVTVTVSREGSVVELSKPMDQNSCQALRRAGGGWGLHPHQQQRIFYLPKVFPFPVVRRNIHLGNVSAPSPAHT